MSAQRSTTNEIYILNWKIKYSHKYANVFFNFKRRLHFYHVADMLSSVLEEAKIEITSQTARFLKVFCDPIPPLKENQ